MILSTLFTAWFLTLFNMDEIIVNAVNEIFSTDFSTNIYWFGAFIIGVLGDLGFFGRRS